MTCFKNCFKLIRIIVLCKITIFSIKRGLCKKEPLINSLEKARLNLVIARANIEAYIAVGINKLSLLFQLKLAKICLCNIDKVLKTTEG